MTEQTKTYPGDLQSIPPGTNAKREQANRIQALLEFFGISLADLPTIKATRDLVEKIVKKHKPQEIEWLLLVIPHLDQVGLNALLLKLSNDFLPGCCIRTEPESKKRGRPKKTGTEAELADRRKSELYAIDHLIQSKHLPNERSSYSKVLQCYLQHYAHLKPKRRLVSGKSTALKSTASKIRTLRSQINKAEDDFYGTLGRRWKEFLSQCDPEYAKLIERYFELTDKIQVSGDEEQEKLSAERYWIFLEILIGPQKLNEWREICKKHLSGGDPEKLKTELAAWEGSFSNTEARDFVVLNLGPRDKYLLKGLTALAEPDQN